MASPGRDYQRSLYRGYAWFTIGLLVFISLLAVLERFGLSRSGIGYLFLVATISVYAAIGIRNRTADSVDYYVAGRRVPAVFNGMATAADWMSAASFISLAGTLYLTGFNGLAFIMGWTGGYCLVALLLAPYLRKFGQFTIPDFFGARYGGHLVRGIALAIAILVSFTYLVAQIYGVGLITTRLTGVSFALGIFLGLGGMLVCSFLGGMKAVTWTQVAQYIILVFAYLIPVVWLSVKHTGVPVPQLVYGQVLEKLSLREKQLLEDPREIEVRALLAEKARIAADKIAHLPASLDNERARLVRAVDELRAGGAGAAEIAAAERTLREFPRHPEAARAAWSKDAAMDARAQAPTEHAAVYPGRDEKTREVSRRNFLALVFCLMLGTAALPHVLARYYTTPSVREARDSVFWSLFFISIVYFTVPALAVLAKYDVYSLLVGSDFARLPSWVASWQRVEGALLSIIDINGDGIVQLAEITFDSDIIVLATPEIAGLPYVVSGLVAAGGLAAALSTADGLLLTIANALSHDLYYKMIDPGAATAQRVTISKVLLMVVALAAAAVAAQKPADILFLVSAAFSLAAAGFFPALVLGIFWKRANTPGACLGMLAGLGTTFYYMAMTQPWLRGVFGVTSPIAEHIWWDIQPISAGVFGVPVGFAVMIAVSLMTRAPAADTGALVEHMRDPRPDPGYSTESS